MAKSVADQFAEILATAGVKRIYGIVGDGLNGLTDAIQRQGQIEWVPVRHQEVAAACAEAHLTGELAVCAGNYGYCELISGASRMPLVLQVAIREAVDRHAVAVVVIPGDVALQPAGDVSPPMAETTGVRGIRIEAPAEVEKGIAAPLAHDGPALIDAVVARTELAMPPSITIETAKGFTVNIVKALIGGRADEISPRQISGDRAPFGMRETWQLVL